MWAQGQLCATVRQSLVLMPSEGCWPLLAYYAVLCAWPPPKKQKQTNKQTNPKPFAELSCLQHNRCLSVWQDCFLLWWGSPVHSKEFLDGHLVDNEKKTRALLTIPGFECRIMTNYVKRTIILKQISRDSLKLMCRLWQILEFMLFAAQQGRCSDQLLTSEVSGWVHLHFAGWGSALQCDLMVASGKLNICLLSDT